MQETHLDYCMKNLIKRICDWLGLDAKKNDYVKTEEVNGYCLKNLQVDWHVYKIKDDQVN